MSDIWTPSPELRKDLLYHPDLSCRHEHFRILPDEDQDLLGRLERQSERWLHKPYFKANLQDRRIAVLNGYHRSTRLLDCMMVKNKFTHTRYLNRCKLAWFCPFCAYLKGQDQLQKYGPAWDDGLWHWMVFSIRGGIEVADPDRDRLSEVWDAMKRCRSKERLEEVFEGYQGHLAWEELAVYRFWPRLLWTPHLNILVRSSTEPDRKRFERIVDEEWYRQDPSGEHPSSERLRSRPNVFVQRPNSEAHFQELLGYVKPIDLLTPYNSGFEQAKTDCRSRSKSAAGVTCVTGRSKKAAPMSKVKGVCRYGTME